MNTCHRLYHLGYTQEKEHSNARVYYHNADEVAQMQEDWLKRPPDIVIS